MSNVPRRARQVVSVGHSFVVALNRRWAHEAVVAGEGRWEVTTVAPNAFHDELRAVTLEKRISELYRLESVPMFGTRFVHGMFYGAALKKILRRDWDVVHAWEEPYVAAGAQIAYWTPKRIPLIFRTFQNISKNYPPPFSLFERYSLRRAAGWIASGQTVHDALVVRPGYRSRPFRTIPPGVDFAVFHPDKSAAARIRELLGWAKPQPPVVGYLGRFVPEKGLDLLMRTLDQLKAPWRALFVGTGRLEGTLRKWAHGHGDRVRIANTVTHDEVPKYLNAMDILCAPSQTTPTWREQFGRMLTEAFACGVPVLASDSGEIPHVVADAGVVVGERDVAGWNAALQRLLTDPALREDLSARGLERARKLYGWPQVASQTLQFFEDILDSRQ